MSSYSTSLKLIWKKLRKTLTTTIYYIRKFYFAAENMLLVLEIDLNAKIVVISVFCIITQTEVTIFLNLYRQVIIKISQEPV